MEIRCYTKKDFFDNIKILTFAEDCNIVLVQNGISVATFILHCNDAIVNLKGRTKNASIVTMDIKRQTGESVPIDEIINWFETNVYFD